jgi:hypothetical protein
MIRRGSVAVGALQGMASSIGGAGSVATAFTSPGLSAQTMEGACSAIPTPPPVLFLGGTEGGAPATVPLSPIGRGGRRSCTRTPSGCQAQPRPPRRGRRDATESRWRVFSRKQSTVATPAPTAGPHPTRRIIPQYQYDGDPSGPIMKSKLPGFLPGSGGVPR